MPHAEAVAAVVAHEVGHAMELTSPGPGVVCGPRGCHCLDPSCVMNDGHGGCPQPGKALCARCRPATRRDLLQR